MIFDVTRPMTARELFRLNSVEPKQGKPGFMNLRALRRPGRAITKEQLTGAGIYGLFLHGSLYYIGIFAGSTRDALSGTVLVRWKKHLTYQALRSPEVCFSRSNLGAILDDAPNPAFDAIAQTLGGREVDRDLLDADEHPLLQRHGASCTYAKARFAARHWDVFGPGNEEAMADGVSFVFARLKPEALADAAPMDAPHRAWIKHKWLGRCETAMIGTLNPICNAQTPIGEEESGTVDDFARALKEASRPAFAPYIPTDGEAAGKVAEQNEPASKVTDEQEAPHHNDETEDVGGEIEAVDPQEQRFRDKLSPDCDAFVDELDELLPVGIDLKFMKKPGFRLHQEPGHHVLLMVSPRSGGMVGKVGASVSIARTLGFQDADLNNDGKWVDFTIDPAVHQPSALLTLAGAAMKSKRN